MSKVPDGPLPWTTYAPDDPRSWTTGRQVSLWLLSQAQRSRYRRWHARYDADRDLWILPTGSLVPRWKGSYDVADEPIDVSTFSEDEFAGLFDDEWPDENEAALGSCYGCKATWTGYRICHCAACHMTFTAVGGFDAHRIGRDDARRCLTPAELTDKGYEPNDRNQWRIPAPEGAFTNRGTTRA
jgi:hypothetical protein